MQCTFYNYTKCYISSFEDAMLATFKLVRGCVKFLKFIYFLFQPICLSDVCTWGGDDI